MNIYLDGMSIQSELAFHKALALALRVQDFYGCNLDALWDLLSVDAERPIKIIWQHHSYSKSKMGNQFSQIIEVFDRVQAQDTAFGWINTFSYLLD